jgi:hypothetical protein
MSGAGHRRAGAHPDAAGRGTAAPAPWLVATRDDGPLAPWLAAPGRLPVPAVAMLAAGLALLAGAAAGLGLGDVAALGTPAGAARAWPWAAAALLLAVLSTAGRARPRLDWPIPALLRGLEYGTVVLLAGADPWSYALLATLAAHHYDIVYRVRMSAPAPPRWLLMLTGGWAVRSAVVVVAAAAGEAAAAVTILTVLLAPAVVVASIATWSRRARRAHVGATALDHEEP